MEKTVVTTTPVVDNSVVLIIANRINAFDAANSFLARRGLKCIMASNVKQAIKFIPEHKPAFVLLSWNIKNSNIHKTYKLISTTFKCFVIVYAENSDGKTATDLVASRLPEIMQAPVSGPSIYMKIQRILKARADALEGDTNPGIRETSGSTEESPAIAISGADIPKEGEWQLRGQDKVTNKSVWELAAKDTKHKGKAGIYTFKGTGPPKKKSSGGWQTDGGEAFFEEKKLKKNTQTAFTEKELEELALQLEENSDDTSENTGEAKDELAPTPLMESENSSKPDSIIQKGISNNSKLMEAIQKGASGNEFEDVTKGSNEIIDVVLPSEDTQDSGHSSTADETPPVLQTSIHPNIGSIEGKNTNSVLAKSTFMSLQSVVVAQDSNDTKKVNQVKKLAVITINTTQYRGYLLITSSNDKNINDDILNELKKHIHAHLKGYGEVIDNLKHIFVEVESIDFKQWGKQAADFIALAPHYLEEWAVAFFPFQNIAPKLEVKNQNRVGVDINDIFPNVPLTFDLCMHLPINNRNFIYCRTGQHISDKQKARMQEAKSHKLFISPDAVNNFMEFFISYNVKAKALEYKNDLYIVAS